MQDNYNFWHVRQTVNLEVVEKIEFRVAELIQSALLNHPLALVK